MTEQDRTNKHLDGDDNAPKEQAGPLVPPEQPAQPTQGTDNVQSAPPRRPLPEYGEYAPSQPQPTAEAQPGSVARSDTEPRAASSAQPATPGGSGGALTGVPHNLGVAGRSKSGELPARGTNAPGANTQGSGSPQAAPPPQAPLRASSRVPSQPALPPAAPSGGRIADRVVTVLLLVLGAYFALSLSLSFMTLGTQLFVLADAVGIEEFRAPDAVNTIGTVGVFMMLTLFAVTLIWSVQRLRAGKVTFWVPLAAGALSFILLVALTWAAIAQTPELLEGLDPENLEKLMVALNSQG